MSARGLRLVPSAEKSRTGSRVYISGPMTGQPGMNHDAFNEAEKALAEVGLEPVNPARHPSGLSWPEYMQLDIADLIHCAAVAVLPGWQGTRGARIETRLASDLGLPFLALSEIVRGRS